MKITEGKMTNSFFTEAAGLLKEHWDELTQHKSLQVLKPDIERYLRMEAAGSLLTLFAHDGEQMVGYSVSWLNRNLHYADLVCAQNDVLFISQSHRNTGLGLKLIEATEQLARARGANMMIWHAKQDTALHKLLPNKGYWELDILFQKVLQSP